MKRQIGIGVMISFGFLTMAVLGIGTTGDLDPSLVAYWPMDEGSGNMTYDVTTNGNDGEIYGATWTDGICRKALRFDGMESHVELQTPVIGDLGEWTLVAWINVEEGDVPVWDDDGGHVHTIYGEYTSHALTKNFVLLQGHKDENTWVWWPYFDNYPPPGHMGDYLAHWDELKSGAPIYLQEWYHVAFSKAGENICFWYQGSLAGCYPYEHYGSGAPPTHTWLGKRDLSSNWEDYVYHGAIDEMKIYNRALTAEEINADYEAGLTCLLLDVAIDIKPGSDPNSINLKSKGVIPVAVLTTPEFDAADVDPTTVGFGPDTAGIAHSAAHLEDVDGDGDIDLLMHFRTQETGIQCGDTYATLTGETFDGSPIEGSDSIKTVGCK